MAKYPSKIREAKEERKKANQKANKKSKRPNHREAYYIQKPREDESNHRLADFHVHSIGSSDGRYEIRKIIKRAKDFGIKYLSVTDHNNFNETINLLNSTSSNLYMPIHDIAGVNFVPGVEITCRVPDVKNYKGNDLKIHLLVHAPILTPNSYLRRLMDIKHGNDLAVDFGMLINMAKQRGISLDPSDIREYIIDRRKDDTGFSSFGKDDVLDFLDMHGYSIAKSMREYTDLFDSIPRAERLNLSAKDVIDIAHASGGICTMAHPKVNLHRTKDKREAVNTLLEYGIDGFELLNTSMDNDTFELIHRESKNFCGNNNIIFTGGSDFHIFAEHSKLGQFGGLPITTSSQSHMIAELRDLERARKEKCLTSRIYDLPMQCDIESCIDKYSRKAHEINEMYLDNEIAEHDEAEDFCNSSLTYIQYLQKHGVYPESKKYRPDERSPID